MPYMMMPGDSKIAAEKIHAEVPHRVSPDRVDVVGIVLRVVVLDEQARPLDPVVVGLATLTPAGPGEVHRVEGRPGQPCRLWLRDLLWQTVDVLADEGHEELPLLRRHPGRGETLWCVLIAQGGKALVGRLRAHRFRRGASRQLGSQPGHDAWLDERAVAQDDVGWGHRGDDRRRYLVGVE
jgi:hypothetical protein